MNVDRLRGWLRKRPVGGVRVQLAIEHVSTGAIAQIAEWTKEEIESSLDAGSADVASAILDEAQNHTDAEGEPCRFAIRWIGPADRPLANVPHKCNPDPDSLGARTPTHSDPALAAMLGHIAQQQKTMNLMVGSFAANSERLVTLLSGHLDAALKREREAPAAAAVPLAISDEQKEEALQRAAALGAFSSKLPEIIDLGLAALAQKLLPPVNPSH